MWWWASLAVAGGLQLEVSGEVTVGGIDPVGSPAIASHTSWQDCPGGRWTTLTLSGGYAGTAGRLLVDQSARWLDASDAFAAAVTVDGVDALADAAAAPGCARVEVQPWWSLSQRVDAYTWSGGDPAGRRHAARALGTLDTRLVIDSAVAFDAGLPVRLVGHALGAESFGEVERTGGTAAYDLSVRLGVATAGASAEVVSLTILPARESFDEVVWIPARIPAGRSTWTLEVDASADVAAEAVGAGLRQLIIGAATALGEATLEVGPLRSAGDAPLPYGVAVWDEAGSPVFVDTRTDCDGDGLPDDPTTDTDGDGVYDACDVCPDQFDPDQADFNRDRIGDACDTCEDPPPPLPLFPDFTCATGLTYGGDAAEIDGRVQLLYVNRSFQLGTLWFERPVSVADGFATTFTVEVDSPAGITDSAGLRGADGLAFVIRGGGTGAGAAGGSIGYGGLTNVVVIEYDDFSNGWDPVGAHVGVLGSAGAVSVDHAVSGLAEAVVVADRTGQGPFTFDVLYDGAVLEVWLDGEPVTAVEIDLAAFLSLAGDEAWVGFTAGTGSASENLVLRSWEWAGPELDCDEDGVPDACALDCEAWGGACRIPGCGLAADCDDNGLPDGCDAADPERDCDGDGLVDTCHPFDDCDEDGTPDACQDLPDSDADGVPNPCDPWPTDAMDDPDGDGIPTVIDFCALLYDPEQEDADGDRVGDACDPCPADPTNRDTDRDGVCDAADTCPALADPEQDDADGDGVGDACDNCPATSSADLTDSDGDGVGDACDPCPTDPLDGDRDLDGVCDVEDACPDADDPTNTDTDADGVGNACDNCPLLANAGQANADGDALGDACDPCPTTPGTTCADPELDSDGDGLPDLDDPCPEDPDPACEEPDTEVDPDPDTDLDTDTDTEAAPGGCSCEAGSGSPTPGALLLALALAARRRTRRPSPRGSPPPRAARSPS